MVYTHAGGSYVVGAGELRAAVAQVGAVALMIDYIVTVAVQAAAGTAAVTSAVPGAEPHDSPWRSPSAWSCVLFYGNLRGLREAGRTFAFPTYFFVGSMRWSSSPAWSARSLGDLPHDYDLTSRPAAVRSTRPRPQLLAFVRGLRAAARRSPTAAPRSPGWRRSPTGSACSSAAGPNARRTLVVMSCILGTLVAGVSWLAHQTHAVPYESGTPTVISQVAQAVLGHNLSARRRSCIVQLATDADPLHRREHAVQRLPVPRQLRGRGLVPAALADQARPPAGLLQRHHRPGRCRRSR